MATSVTRTAFMIALVTVAAGCGMDLHVTFDDVGGVQAEDPVLWQGVAIGKVTGVSVAGGRPTVDLHIDRKHAEQLKQGAALRIRVPGLLDSGPRAVVVEDPGSGPVLSSGDQLEGTTRVERLVGQLKAALGGVVKEFGDWASELDKLADDPEMRPIIERAQAEAEKAAEAGEAAVRRFRKDTLPKLRKELEALQRELEDSGKIDQAKRVGDEIVKLFE